jgi:hypothetical protein
VRMNDDRRARINHWLSDDQYEWWVKRGPWSDRFVEAQFWLIEKPARWVLCQLFGHEPIPDQCGRREHDYCVWCGRRMPGAAPRQD